MEIKTVEDFKKWMLTHEPKYQYMMLDRMRSDCDYIIKACACNPVSFKYLWFEHDPVSQIEAMKFLWEILPEKPEWLTMEQIEEYEEKLCEKVPCSD